MGQAVLKSHLLGGKYFKPDGWFGREDNRLVLPFEDATLIDGLCQDFKLSRGTEVGLELFGNAD